MNETILLESVLDKEEVAKYNIVKMIYNARVDEISSSEIAKILKISINTVYNLLEMINNDFRIFFSVPLIQIEKGKKLKKIDTNISPILYRTYLFKNSIIYDFLMNSLFTEEVDFEEFCDTHFISSSSMKRKISKLKTIFNRFNVRFSFSKFSFTGREDNVRSFAYNILWVGTQGVFWPFDTIDINKLQNSIKSKVTGDHFLLNELIQTQFCFMIAIFILRSSANHRIESINNYDYLISENKYFDALFYEFEREQLPYLNKDDLNFLYILATSKPIFSRLTPYCEYQLQYFEKSIPDIFKMCLNLNEFISSKTNLVSKDLPSFIFCNLINITISTYVQGIGCIQLPPKKTQVYKRLVYILDEFFKSIELRDNFMNINQYKDILIEQYAVIILEYFGETIVSHPKKVGIIWDIERLSLDHLIRTLSAYPEIEIVELNLYSDKSECQLIVSTEPVSVPDGTVVYLWQQTTFMKNIINIFQNLDNITFKF